MGRCGKGAAARGMTLVELLVASGIGLVVLLLAVAFLVPAMHVSQQGAVRMELAEQAITTLDHLVADLRTSTSGGVTVTSGAIAIQQLDQVLTTGTQIWKHSLVVYQWDATGGKLIRKEFGSTAAGLVFQDDQPVALSDDEMATLEARSVPGAALQASHVTRFQVTRVWSPAPSPSASGDAAASPSPYPIDEPITITISISQQDNTGTGQPVTFQYSRTYSLRNRISS